MHCYISGPSRELLRSSPEQRNGPIQVRDTVTDRHLSRRLILPWAWLRSRLLLFHHHLSVQANNILIHCLSIALFCCATPSTETLVEIFVQVFTFLSRNTSIMLPVRIGIVPSWNRNLKSKTPKKYVFFLLIMLNLCCAFCPLKVLFLNCFLF